MEGEVICAYTIKSIFDGVKKTVSQPIDHGCLTSFDASSGTMQNPCYWSWP